MTDNGTPIKHTGDPSTVKVTVPPGAPAVSAPTQVSPDQVQPAGAPGSQAAPSHLGDPRTLGQPQAPRVELPDGMHPEVASIDLMMDLHQSQLRTQRMLLAVGVMILGAAIIITVARAREQLIELEPIA